MPTSCAISTAIQWKHWRFFSVRDNSTVMEKSCQQRRYYLEILAPYLNTRGVYIAANGDVGGAGLSCRSSEDSRPFKENPEVSPR